MLYASGINSILISDIQKQTYHLTTNKLKQHFMIKQLFSLVVVAFSTLNLNAQNIIFYDNFENGLKNDWTLSSTLSNGVAGINANPFKGGIWSMSMGKSSDAGGYNTNRMDLRINLAGQTKVDLQYYIRSINDETNVEDGIFMSDDNGATFTKVYSFEPQSWQQLVYGAFPSLHIDELAATNGLSLNSQFVIRFQQHDDADFSTSNSSERDGIYIDEVAVYIPATNYTSLPFCDDFESGSLNDAWSREFADNTALPASNVTRICNSAALSAFGADSSAYKMQLGKTCADGGAMDANAIDLHLNLAWTSNVFLNFDIYNNQDEDDVQDGIWMSDDGGVTFVKTYDFNMAALPQNVYTSLALDLSQLATTNGLSLTSNFIVRFQQMDDHEFNNSTDQDGYYLDNVCVNGILGVQALKVENKFSVSPNPVKNMLTVNVQKQTDSPTTISIINILGDKVLETTTSSQQNVIDVSKLKRGIYFLKIENRNGSSVKRIVLN